MTLKQIYKQNHIWYLILKVTVLFETVTLQGNILFKSRTILDSNYRNLQKSLFSTFFFYRLYLEEAWVSLLKQSGSAQFPGAASAILAQSLLSEVCYVG